MCRKSKISKIYEVIAEKHFNPDIYWDSQWRYEHDPVMIWDVLDWIESWKTKDNWWWDAQDKVKQFRDKDKYRLPIEEQSDKTISFVFDLISNNE